MATKGNGLFERLKAEGKKKAEREKEDEQVRANIAAEVKDANEALSVWGYKIVPKGFAIKGKNGTAGGQIMDKESRLAISKCVNEGKVNGKHTSCDHGKSKAHNFILNGCPEIPSYKESDLLTVGSGIYSSALLAGWQGHIYTCEIDNRSISKAQGLRKRYSQDRCIERGEEPWHDLKQGCLSIQEPFLLPIQKATQRIIERAGTRTLVIDMDLSYSLPKVMPILISVIDTCIDAKRNGRIELVRILLTYVDNARHIDNNPDLKEQSGREEFLEKSIASHNARLEDVIYYHSERWDEQDQYHTGTNMAVADIRIGRGIKSIRH
jgi:hypothetical protein